MNQLTEHRELSYTPYQGDLSMAGTVRCSGCGKARDDYKCPFCGSYNCYVKLYWKGTDYQYRYYDGGIPYGYNEAERFLNKLRSEIDDHKRKRRTFDPTRYLQSKINELRLVSIVDKWMLDNKKRVEKGELKPGSYDTYDSYRRTHWNTEFTDENNQEFSLRNKDVREITAKDLKKFKDLLPDAISLTYKRKLMNALRTFFKWMHREEIIQVVPPFPTITGADPKKRKAISIESQEFFLEKIPEIHRDIIAFAFETGIREGELAAVKVKDINTASWIFTVRHNYSSGNVFMETTKEGHEDDVPLSDKAVQIAKRNIAGKHPEAFLFINKITGRNYLPQTIYKIWKSTGSPVHFHEAARHSFATHLAQSGATPQQIQTLCRHRDIRTTMNYVHMNVTDLRDLVNKRSEIVSLESVNCEKKRFKIKAPH